MSYNNFTTAIMSSLDVAAYLYEVASNQRKLEYCRQILAANTNFIPPCIFTINPPHSTNTQTKSQFINSIRNLGLGCSAAQEELIFAYFQLDSKNYITFDEFEQLILPQTDQSYKKLIGKRKREDFALDYALRFSLQKYFFQMIENQVKLELMCKFTFAKGKKDEKKIRPKRLDTDALAYFMNAHSKFPDSKTCEFIVREINFNKGETRRNLLIVQYILDFNDKHKLKQPLPAVAKRDVDFVPPPSRRNHLTAVPAENKENKINNYQKSRYLVQENKQGMSAYHELANSFIVPGTQSRVGPTISALNEVENRINMLMSEVSIKTPNYSNLQISRPPIKTQKPEKPHDEIQKVPELKNSILQQIRQQLKKQKEGKSQARADSNFKNISIKSRKEMTDREFELGRNEMKAAIKNKADHILQSKIKKGQSFSFQQDNESFGSSQVAVNPKNRPNLQPSMTASQKLKQLANSNRYEYSNANKNRNKPAQEGKKRIQYLKGLIEQKDVARS